ncbi:MAG: PaaI family thioesterase [Negativicutes bacterium]
MSSSQFSMKKEYLLEIYDRNPFVQFLEMKIADLKEGYSELIMPVDTEKHTNLYNLAHGGALASLADTAMGIACATIGNKVVTLDMNMNFIKGAKPQMGLKGVGKVIHTGRTTMVAEADIIDEDGNLILKARGTFFVIGKFE